MLSVLLTVAPCLAQAQTTVKTGQESDKKMTGGVAMAGQQTREVSLKLEESDRITLRNRFGPIVVTGTSGDSLEATVTEIKKGTIAYTYKIATSRHGREKITIATSVMTPEQDTGRRESKATGTAQGASSASAATKQQTPQTPAPAQPAQPPPGQTAPPSSPSRVAPRTPRTPPTRPAPAPRPEMKEPSMDSLRGVGELRLEVRLPRNARIDLIDSRRYAVISPSGTPSYLTNTRNDVSVTNLDTPVSIFSSGDVQATRVGGLEAKTRASSVSVREVSGPVNITTVTGAVIVKDAQGDVRAVSISGTISIECARGRAEAGTTNGSITLTGIGGDLDVNTTGGTISFTGAIREGGRYRLKSMSGIVRMFIQREPPGFLASLSSYKGQILLDFELKSELSASTATPDLPQTQGQPVRRMMGRYGEGDARITLDSFSGAVQLARSPSEVWKSCR